MTSTEVAATIAGAGFIISGVAVLWYAALFARMIRRARRDMLDLASREQWAEDTRKSLTRARWRKMRGQRVD